MAGLEATIVLACGGFGFFIFFLFKILRIKKTTRELLPFIGLALMFLAMGIGYFISSWFDYYRWENGIEIVLLWKLNTVCVTFGFASLMFLMEVILRKSKFAVTAFLVTGGIIILILNDLDSLRLWFTILGIPFIVIAPIFWYFVFFKQTTGVYRMKMIFAFLGVVIAAVGLVFRNDLLVRSLGTQSYVLGTLMAVCGVTLIAYGFSAFSTLTDLKWKSKLRELFTITNNGVCLYAYSFEQNIPLEDSDLIAVGFSGIQSLLSEMVNTKEPMHMIDYQNVKIIVEQGTEVIFVLIIKEESSFLQYKLGLFANEFQTFFKDLLEHWEGEMTTFQPTLSLVKRVFEIQEINS